jgi:hypothetical protein
MMDLRYPIGPFATPKGPLTPEERRRSIDQIAEAPAKLREAVAGLSARQLETPYRPDGWTVRQVAHHVPDSHINAYVRFKLALTEDGPALQTYEESEWARLPDTVATPVEVSLALLDALHRRWVALLRSLGEKDFLRTARHPSWGVVTVDFLIAQYAWHGRHHVAHITTLRERMGWDA